MRLTPAAMAVLASGASAAVVQKRTFDYPPWLEPRVDQPGHNPDCFNPRNREDNHEYFDCPPKNVMNENGVCTNYDLKNDCLAYCEVKLTYFYGNEIPYDQSPCGKGLCALTETSTAEVSQSFSFNIGVAKRHVVNKTAFMERGLVPREDAPAESSLKNIFNAGASWTWSNSQSKSTGIRLDKPDGNKNDCGYWTFVPYFVTSCGTLSQALFGADSNLDGSKQPDQCFEELGYPHTTGNWCQTTKWLNADGSAGGAAFFVATDCAKGTPLPFCKQDPRYLKEGVADDPKVFQDYRLAHSYNDMSKDVLSTAQINCEKGNWPPQGR